MRLLIVEDEDSIGKFLKKGLEAELFAVDHATDGLNGLKLVRNNDYDLAILDINLPHLDGINLCRQVRESKKNFPVLMLSVSGDTSTKVQSLNAGADDYLTKPFSFEELLARVRALLRREKIIIGPKLAFHDLELDCNSHTVKRAGQDIQLHKKEFSLLEYFMRNAGTTLTRNMILEHVWDMNTDPFTNTVDAHVSFLRKKIDDPFERKLIHTLHGRGYRFD